MLSPSSESSPRDFDALADARTALDRLAGAVSDAAALRVVACAREALANPSVFLPRLPEAAIQAMQVVDSPRCDVLDLADTLNAEPFLAARVVGISNSSFFAGSEPVHTPRDAIVRMGIRETRNVVMGIVLRGLICDGPGFGLERRALWQHSLATAACAQGILCELTFEDSVGFLAGLAHDVGRAALYTWLGEREGADALEPVLGPLTDEAHAALSAAILSHWRLRRELVEAVRWHHDPARRDRLSPMAAALRAADHMAHGLSDGPSVVRRSERELHACLDALGLSLARAETLRTESRARLEELLKIL